MCSWTPVRGWHIRMSMSTCHGNAGRLRAALPGVGEPESFPKAWPGALVVFKARCWGLTSQMWVAKGRLRVGPPCSEELAPLPMWLAGQGFVVRVSGLLPTTWGFLLPPVLGGTGPGGSGFSPRKLPACRWSGVSVGGGELGSSSSPSQFFFIHIFLVSIYLSQHQNLH